MNSLGTFQPLKHSNHHVIFTLKEKNTGFIWMWPEAIKNKELDKIISIQNHLKLIPIHQDLWQTHTEIVRSRIESKCGLHQKAFARSCKIVALNKPEAQNFFQQNHLQGAVGSAYQFGLEKDGELLAAIAFSKARVMTDGCVYYRSYELLRFACKNHLTVVGGLNKLLRHFIKLRHVVHLMTYIDLEWGDGEAFKKLGFIKTGQIEPYQYWVDPNTFSRYRENEITENQKIRQNLIPVWNQGSAKCILDLQKT